MSNCRPSVDDDYLKLYAQFLQKASNASAWYTCSSITCRNMLYNRVVVFVIWDNDKFLSKISLELNWWIYIKCAKEMIEYFHSYTCIHVYTNLVFQKDKLVSKYSFCTRLSCVYFYLIFWSPVVRRLSVSPSVHPSVCLSVNFSYFDFFL